MSDNFQMSATLKGIIAITLVCAVAFFVMLSRNQSNFEAQQLPNGNLDTLQTMGRSEVRSFEDWCQQQGYKGDRLSVCIKRRQARAQLLVAQSKCSQTRASNQLQSLTSQARLQITQEVIKARQPSLQERLSREEAAARAQGQVEQTSSVTENSPPTDLEMTQRIQARFSSVDHLEISKCAYEQVCHNQGYTGTQLAQCVAELQSN